MSFISYLINGISLGSVYAIIALGYTMVYGILKMINFAHADVYMVGAFAAFSPKLARKVIAISCIDMRVLVMMKRSPAACGVCIAATCASARSRTSITCMMTLGVAGGLPCKVRWMNCTDPRLSV